MRMKQLKLHVEANRRGSPHGIASYFVALNDKWGIKLYTCPEERDGCMENQSLAYNVGVGPEVGGKIDLPSSSDNEHYIHGYMTKIVKVAGNVSREEAGLPSDREQCNADHGYHTTRNVGRDWKEANQDEINQLHETLEELGFYFYDSHVENIGIDEDGRIVCIDFGND